MARRLRIEFPGAIYHVINRGNYRRDVFDSVGAAQAFECVLDEATTQFGWRLHAYVVMRNHYHLAIETPQPNLVEGMHWLQSTFSARFNRFRSENGHLFQGRYQALLIEDTAALTRVVNYVHLNPVRAKIVPLEQVAGFRWSSLARFVRGPRLKALAATDWLTFLGLDDSVAGWRMYIQHLAALASDTDPEKEHSELCAGWAIGTRAWRQAVARDHAHLALHQGIAASELEEIKHAHWLETLRRLLHQAGKTVEDARRAAKGAAWKCEIANKLRAEVAAPHRWIASNLHMGSAHSVRSYISRRRGEQNQQLSA